MSLQRGFFIFLFIASLIGVSLIFIRRISEATCPSGDSRICAFVNKNKKIAMETMKGTYIQESGNGTEISIDWEKGKEISKVVITKGEDEILQLISSKKYIFLKDYSDNAWWRQELQLDNNITELPFYPDLYFPKLAEQLLNEATTYKFIQEADCNSKTCYRYQVLYPGQEENEQLFIFFEKNTSKLDSVFVANEDNTSTIAIEYTSVSIQEPEQLKIASSTSNLFLEYLDKKDKPVEKNFEYLKQFQEQRNEVEQIGTVSEVPIQEETPIPEPTL